ncbi:purple acid phosphatase family protein [Siphonobacter curvatus]|uniref:Metallophosphoesterase n=1 Tax=Siphonobacter curvatus TaxID=2094562 RepID=A0A2S7IPS9_9BACT|nr:metallophosphoesterase family protein [Siphonobacter curvatus]PQA59733.1 metallophosphoesterase [Siphonobacter curvatus]
MLKKACLLSLLSVSIAQAQEHKSYTPTAFPDRLIMGYQGNVATSQSMNWRTDSTVIKSVAAIVEADASPDMVAKAQTIDAQTERVVLEGKTVHYHSAHFTNLKPATQYAYRVGDGTHWSEWFHFTTAHDKPAPFSFLYFGDAQNDIRSLWSRAIRGAYSKLPNVQLILHAGDLINSSNTDWQWGEWFEAGGWINGMIPTLAVPGNHEYFKMENGNRRVSYHWRPSFVLPENGPQGLTETAYYIDYQGTRFISLDSQGALLDSVVLEKQANWLLDVLKTNPNRWTIVMHHHPVYSTSKGRDNDEWRDRMEPIYRQYGVDLVLQGHDHTYGRGLNMPLGKSRKQPDGPIYVVSVSGPKMYEIGLQDWMNRAASNIQLFQTIQVSQDTLKYQSYAVTGEKYDAFELIKNAKGKNRLVDHDPELPAERLELPAEYQKRNTPQQKEEYRNRFQEYKARKEAELKKISNR